MDWRWTDNLGVALMGHGLPGRVSAVARAAERAGFGSLWIIEDYFHPGAYTIAAAAARARARRGSRGWRALLRSRVAGPCATRPRDDRVAAARRLRGHRLHSDGGVR